MSGLSKPLNLVFLNLKSPHGEFTIDGCKQEEGEVGPNSLGSGSSLGRCMGLILLKTKAGWLTLASSET